MNKLVLISVLLASATAAAGEWVENTPWQSLDAPYRDYADAEFILLPQTAMPMLSLEQSRYDLRIVGNQAIGTVTLAGNVLAAYPEPVQLFGGEVAVIEVIANDNAMLVASDGAYAVYPQEPGLFLLMLAVSIPVSDFEAGPRLEFEIPSAVTNELVLEAPEHLRLIDTGVLHRVGDRLFFAPTRYLDLGFEHLDRARELRDESGNRDALHVDRLLEEADVQLKRSQDNLREHLFEVALRLAVSSDDFSNRAIGIIKNTSSNTDLVESDILKTERLLDRMGEQLQMG